jgi:hypothetical protein
MNIGISGDTLLWAGDGRNVVHLFDVATGRFIKATNPSLVESEIDLLYGFFAHAHIAGDSFLVEERVPSVRIARGEVTERKVLALNTATGNHVTVATMPRANTQFAVLNTERNGGAYRPQPFSDAPLFASAPGEFAFFIVERPTARNHGTDAFRITKHDMSGKAVASWDYDYSPARISVDASDTAIAEATEMMLFFGEPDSQATRDKVREALYLPAFYPPIAELHVGNDANLWLRVSGEQKPDKMSTWLVVSPNGSPAGRVQLPSHARMLAASEDIWVEVRDELDVSSLVRYGVMKRNES